jgi:drug/metabolite transporter (DMT)-like permease
MTGRFAMAFHGHGLDHSKIVLLRETMTFAERSLSRSSASIIFALSHAGAEMTLNRPEAELPLADNVAVDRRNIAIGVLCGLLVVVMWSAWVVATRFAVTTELTPFDVAFIRYLVASAILAPIVFHHGLALRTLGFGRTALLVCGAGLPFLLMSSTGMSFAPASAAGSVMIGTMPLFVALLSAIFDGERFPAIRKVGFAAVVIGVMLIASQGFAQFQAGAWRGYPFFLGAALLWAGYTIAFRHAGIGVWHAAALINVYSLVIIVPVYLLAMPSHLLTAAISDIVLQAVMQGVIAAVAGLYFYGQAIRRLGASRAAVITSLTPVAAALLGLLFLHEVPSGIAWVGIAIVSAGVALASGGMSRAK